MQARIEMDDPDLVFDIEYERLALNCMELGSVGEMFEELRSIPISQERGFPLQWIELFEKPVFEFQSVSDDRCQFRPTD
jgi:hypothetical protein